MPSLHVELQAKKPLSRLVMVGSHQALGWWDPSQGVPLEWTGRAWETIEPVTLKHLRGHIDYKFVRVGDGTAKWEQGPNRVLEVPSAATSSERSAGPVEVLLSAGFNGNASAELLTPRRAARRMAEAREWRGVPDEQQQEALQWQARYEEVARTFAEVRAKAQAAQQKWREEEEQSLQQEEELRKELAAAQELVAKRREQLGAARTANGVHPQDAARASPSRKQEAPQLQDAARASPSRKQEAPQLQDAARASPSRKQEAPQLQDGARASPSRKQEAPQLQAAGYAGPSADSMVDAGTRTTNSKSRRADATPNGPTDKSPQSVPSVAHADSAPPTLHAAEASIEERPLTAVPCQSDSPPTDDDGAFAAPSSSSSAEKSNAGATLRPVQKAQTDVPDISESIAALANEAFESASPGAGTPLAPLESPLHSVAYRGTSVSVSQRSRSSLQTNPGHTSAREVPATSRSHADTVDPAEGLASAPAETTECRSLDEEAPRTVAPSEGRDCERVKATHPVEAPATPRTKATPSKAPPSNHSPASPSAAESQKTSHKMSPASPLAAESQKMSHKMRPVPHQQSSLTYADVVPHMKRRAPNDGGAGIGGSQPLNGWQGQSQPSRPIKCNTLGLLAAALKPRPQPYMCRKKCFSPAPWPEAKDSMGGSSPNEGVPRTVRAAGSAGAEACEPLWRRTAGSGSAGTGSPCPGSPEDGSTGTSAHTSQTDSSAGGRSQCTQRAVFKVSTSGASSASGHGLFGGGRRAPRASPLSRFSQRLPRTRLSGPSEDVALEKGDSPLAADCSGATARGREEGREP